MLKPLTSSLTLLATLATSAAVALAEPDRWQYMGIASTGEEVYLKKDSISLALRGIGYFFSYQIGEERPFAFTPCDGRFQVVGLDGVIFGKMREPESEATAKMLERVCDGGER